MEFHWPVGDEFQRVEYWKLPGWWEVACTYGQRYDATGKMAIHTGLDLNLNRDELGKRHFDADAHAPVYAAENGVVVFAGKLPVWGSVITIKHISDTLPTIWTRYAHVEQERITAGERVTRGQQLAQVGNADGRYPYHLHYDLARIDLGARPGDWPGDDAPRVFRDYLNPIQFMWRQLMNGQGAVKPLLQIKASPSLRVRAEPNGAIIGRVGFGEIVEPLEICGEWVRIEQPLAGWIALTWTSPVEVQP